MTATNISKVLRVFAASLLILAVTAATARAAENDSTAAPPAKAAKPADLTLVGHGNQATEISKDGTVTNHTPGSLVLKNRGKGSMAAFPPPLMPEMPTEVEAPVTKAAEDTSAEDAEAAAKRAVEKAKVDSDRRAIEEMRESRYMWFFDENGKVMTTRELDRRVAEGNFGGIKAMSDDREEWTPSSARKAADDSRRSRRDAETAESESPPPPPRDKSADSADSTDNDR